MKNSNVEVPSNMATTKSSLYPAFSINDVIDFLELTKKYPAGRPISYDTMAEECGLKSSYTKSLKYKISSAKQYGCIETSDRMITLTELGNTIIRPISDEELFESKITAVKNPPLFKKLFEKYEGKPLPQQTALENILVRDYKITESSKKVAAETFIKCLDQVGAINAGVISFDLISNISIENKSIEVENENIEEIDASISSGVDNIQNNLSPIDIKCKEDYEAPLTIPMGNQRKAILYMPVETTKKEAEYVKAMISMMFDNLYE